MAAQTRLSKADSIARTHAKYEMRLALLQSWENRDDADPEYLIQLQREVRQYHNQLVYKGAICPNET
jgi:hypothetical protein